MAKITNKDLLTYVMQKSPQAKSLTSKVTDEIFTVSGFERMKNLDYNVLHDIYFISLRAYLQLVNVAEVKDPLENAGFGESFETEFGAMIQRMAVHPIKPVSPAWVKLTNGSSVDPFVVRTGKVDERLWRKNFDFQTFLTVPDDFTLKQMFVSEYGLSEFIDGQIKQLKNSYILQKYLARKEAINAFINGTVDVLQDTQNVSVEWTEGGTDVQMVNFILTVKNIVSLMKSTPSLSAFNSLHFETVQDISRLKLLIRVGFKNKLAVQILRNSFNAENLNLPVDVIEVDNFGGLQPYKESRFTTKLYPVYDNLGSEIGFSTAQNQIGVDNIEVETSEVFWKDPNADVIAVLADKGLVFTTTQEPFRIDTIYNPRGRYTNYWASSAQGAVLVDPLYNGIVFRTADASSADPMGGKASSSLPPGYVP